jgi:hypothetical protein
MPTTLPFARFIQLMKAIEQLPMPAERFNRHRMQYDYILGQLCLAKAKGKDITVADLTDCVILGSLPTANKRLQELIACGLMISKEGDDRRQRILILSEAGHQYMTACSNAMEKAIQRAHCA